MCYPAGSLEHATAVCVLCTRVWPQPVCKHTRAVCKERANHPGYVEVSYFTNAEFEVFNGCGFCKWAASRWPGKNLGWPGCCRAPHDTEVDLIPDGSWRAVSSSWKVPIPDKVKRRLAQRPSVIPAVRKGDAPPASHRQSSRISPPGSKDAPPRGNKPLPSDLTAYKYRPERCESSRPVTSSGTKGPVRPSQLRTVSLITAGTSTPSRTRSSENVDTMGEDAKAGAREALRASARVAASPAQLEKTLANLDLSKGSVRAQFNKRTSITSMSDMTDFTDYLSDESEIRLQREAEERALERRRNLRDEAEFMQARRGLEPVGTEPPAGWHQNPSPPALEASFYNAGRSPLVPQARGVPVGRYGSRDRA